MWGYWMPADVREEAAAKATRFSAAKRENSGLALAERGIDSL